jgi:hypothetical protein
MGIFHRIDWRRGLFSRLAAVIAASASSSLAIACSCSGGEAYTRFDDVQHVFVVRVVSVADRNDQSFGDRVYSDVHWELDSYGVRARYVAEHVIKGDPSKVEYLYSSYGGPDCGVVLYPGTLHIVGTNTGEISSCGFHLPLLQPSCAAIQLIHHMQERVKNKTTEFTHADVGAAMGPTNDAAIFKDAYSRGIGPWDVNPDDCPISSPLPEE